MVNMEQYYKRFALTQKVENKVILQKIDKDIDTQIKHKELEQKYAPDLSFAIGVWSKTSKT